MPIRLPPYGLIVAGCLVLNLSMVTLSLFPALIPVFRADWALSNTEAGWISGIYYLGLLGAVAVMTALTDRIEARAVVLAGLAISLVSALGFALSADGTWTAGFWRLCQGIGLGGTYIPGLRLLTDHLPESHRSRGTSFYTASYYLMAGLSFFIALELEALVGWRWAFGISALGPLAGLLCTILFLPPAERPQPQPGSGLFDFGSVAKNRPAVGYSLLYSLHNLEVMAFNAWLVALLVYSQSRQDPGALGLDWNLGILAALITMAALPASIGVNEISQRIGRRPVIVAVMLCSAAWGLLLGALPGEAYWLVVALAFGFSALMAADSATITSGVVLTADPRTKGRTMSFYAIVGNVGAFVGPFLFGATLDLAGGESAPSAWFAGFAAIAACTLLGPLFIVRLLGKRGSRG